ncbi:hypothetical protein LOAG_19048, partial [Loa loa]|uniref:Flg_hook domain-containing protein n=1 Tax=Loa loa TaxID=7209 RepID=A0A1I7VHS1_LOALO
HKEASSSISFHGEFAVTSPKAMSANVITNAQFLKVKLEKLLDEMGRIDLTLFDQKLTREYNTKPGQELSKRR